MVKKNNKTTNNNVVNNNSNSITTTTSSSSSIPPSSSSSAASSSSVHNDTYLQVIDKLLTLNLNTSEDDLLYNKKKLLNQYNQLCTDNILNSQRVLYLSRDLTKLESIHERLLKEYTKVKNEYSTSNNKYQKLLSLSNQLSDRMKDNDYQSSLELKKQQEQRLQISQNFSTDITMISQQFERLIKRREAAINENHRLKIILNQYLEEYNTYNQQQQLESSTNHPQEQPSLVDNKTTISTDNTTNTISTDNTTNAISTDNTTNDSNNEETSLTTKDIHHSNTIIINNDDNSTIDSDMKDMEEIETHHMEWEDLYMKYNNTIRIEIDLKQKAMIHSQTFDQFQKQLVNCNQDFKTIQDNIEATHQKIQLIDKNKTIYMNRITECMQSTKKQNDDLNIIEIEKQKYLKLIDKCHSLNETLSKDINDYSSST